VREIKFRGKRVDTNEWVYGVATIFSNGDAIILSESPQRTMHVVDAETVGQYTGLKDKNGKEIYEGDIIEWLAMPNLGVALKIVLWRAIVKYSHGSVRADAEKSYLQGSEVKLGKVIGNIHENSELLKGGD